MNAPATVSELKAVCRNCHGGGTIVRLENGVVTEVAGDPDMPASAPRVWEAIRTAGSAHTRE